MSFSFRGSNAHSEELTSRRTQATHGAQPLGPTVYPAHSDARTNSVTLTNRSSSTPAAERRQTFLEVGKPSPSGKEGQRPTPLTSVGSSSPVKTAPAMTSPSHCANGSFQDSSALLASTSSTGTTLLVAPDTEIHTRLSTFCEHLSPGLATTRSGYSDASTIAVPFFPRPVPIGPVANGVSIGVQANDAEVLVSRRGSPRPKSPTRTPLRSKVVSREKPSEQDGHAGLASGHEAKGAPKVEDAETARAWAEAKTAEFLLRPVAASLERLKTSIEQTTPQVLLGDLSAQEASPSPISELLVGSRAASPDFLGDLSPSAILARPVDADNIGSAKSEDDGIGDEILLTEALTRLQGQLGTLEAILTEVEGSPGNSVNACSDKAA